MNPATATEASEIMRGLIDRIVLTPADGILQANLYGDLASLMNFAETQEPATKSAGPPKDPALPSVVAGTRNPGEALKSTHSRSSAFAVETALHAPKLPLIAQG